MSAAQVEFHHLVFGVKPGEGYTLAAWSPGVARGRYESRLQGHLIPVRDAVLEEPGFGDAIAILQIPGFRELLLCRIARGTVDEFGRRTLANHMCVVPRSVVASGGTNLRAVLRAMRDFSAKNPEVQGEIPFLQVGPPEPPSPEEVLPKLVSQYSLESAVNRYFGSPAGGVVLLCRETTSQERVDISLALFEFLDLRHSVVTLHLISGGPTRTSRDLFNLIVTARGVGLEGSDKWVAFRHDLDGPVIPRSGGRPEVYGAIGQWYGPAPRVSVGEARIEVAPGAAAPVARAGMAGRELQAAAPVPASEEEAVAEPAPEAVPPLEEVSVGFECGTGKPVTIIPGHLFICGLSQKSGKTTTLEALLSRSNLRAIVFKTKPGETSFAQGNPILPYLRPALDWWFLENVLEAQLGESIKDVRATLIRFCKGARTLDDAKRRIEMAFRAGVKSEEKPLLLLHAYFDRLFKEFEGTTFDTQLDLRPGVNVMDLTQLGEEVQSIVISSVLSAVLDRATGTVVVVPEAWKFIPQMGGNPCKAAVEKLARQGAVRHNFVWFDSQDIAGVAKALLKNVSIWILGRQTEKNEVEHTLEQIPVGLRERPRADDIMTLGVGVFFVCDGVQVRKTYVMPRWMQTEEARQKALGIAAWIRPPDVFAPGDGASPSGAD